MDVCHEVTHGHSREDAGAAATAASAAPANGLGVEGAAQGCVDDDDASTASAESSESEIEDPAAVHFECDLCGPPNDLGGHTRRALPHHLRRAHRLDGVDLQTAVRRITGDQTSCVQSSITYKCWLGCAFVCTSLRGVHDHVAAQHGYGVPCVQALEWMSSYGLCLQRLCGCVFCRLLPVRTVMVEGGDAGVRAWLQDRLKKNREHFVKTHTYPNGLRLRCHMLVTRHVLYSLPV